MLDDREVDIAFRGELDQIRRVGRGQDRGVRPEELDRLQQQLAVAGAERDVARADPVEGRERDARDERAGVVRRHDAIARGET